MSEINRIIKNASFLFLGSVFADLGAFLFRVIIANNFGPGAFGLFSLAFMTFNIATMTVLLGLPDGIITFISKFRTNNKPNRIAGVLLVSGVVSTSLSSVVVLVIWITAPLISHTLFSTSELVPILRMFVLGIPAKSIIALTGAVCLSYERAGLQSLLRRIFPKVGIITAAVFVVYSAGGITTVVKWFVVTLWVIASIGLVLTFTLVRSEPITGVAPNPIKLLSFSTPLFLAGFIGFFLNWTDTILVGFFMTSEKVGIYQSAYLLGTSVLIFRRVISNSLYPNFGSLDANDRHEALRNRYNSSVIWITILGIAPTIYLIIFPDQVLRILFGDEFSSGGVVLIMIVSSHFLAAMFGPSTNVLKIFGESDYILKTQILAVVINMIINIALIPWIGLIGAAIGTSIGVFIINIFHYYRVKEHLDISLPAKNILQTGGIAIFIGVFLKWSVGTISGIWLLTAHIVTFTLIYSFCLVVCGIVGIEKSINKIMS